MMGRRTIYQPVEKVSKGLNRIPLVLLKYGSQVILDNIVKVNPMLSKIKGDSRV